MENLINELLFLNKNIVSNNIEENIKVWTLIKNIVSNLKVIQDKKWISVNIEIKKDFKIFSNPFLLDKLFWNLIKNALFYTEKWSIKIIIDNKKVIIKDTWIWINKKDLENIWNRFYRAEKSRNNNFWWFWLWLSIVKKIIDENNWKINVKSEVWIWTEFIIEF
jgi:signal transduction histidine kinase